MISSVSKPKPRSDIPQLLRVLDAIVTKTPEAPPFRGTMCVGIRGEPDTWWWIARFGSPTKTEFSLAMPDPVDVAIGLSKDDTLASLFNPDNVEKACPRFLTGKPSLLMAFIGHYLSLGSNTDE